MTIPASVDEITAGWLGEALDADVVAVEVVDAHSGTTGRAKIQVDSGGSLPDTLFVKLRPFDEEQAEFLKLIGLGTAEAKFYAAVGKELPVRIPQVWHSAYDDADGSFVMVLEDLEASGCRFATPDDDDVLATAESLMVELAKLHSAYCGQELEWLGIHALSPGDSPEARENMAMGAMIVQSALDQFAEQMPSEFRQLGELYTTRTHDIAALWNEGERTLVHADNHIGNLFVDDGRTGFYDWAVASRYPGMRDVAYFLCNSLPTDVRRVEQDRLITRYLDGLSAGGVQLDRATAEEQYRLFSVYSWISATTTYAMGSRLQPVEVGRAATERTTQAIIDLDVLGLLAERL